MKVTAKLLIVFAVFFLAFTNRASADFNWGDQHSSYGDKGGWGDHDGDKGDHGDKWHHRNGGGSGGLGHPGVAPEPVSYILFLVGAGILALSYRQRKQVTAAA